MTCKQPTGAAVWGERLALCQFVSQLFKCRCFVHSVASTILYLSTHPPPVNRTCNNCCPLMWKTTRIRATWATRCGRSLIPRMGCQKRSWGTADAVEILSEDRKIRAFDYCTAPPETILFPTVLYTDMPSATWPHEYCSRSAKLWALYSYRRRGAPSAALLSIR